MNSFTDKFAERLKKYWGDASERERLSLQEDMLAYAKADPARFMQELAPIQFGEELDPLPVLFDAMAKDADDWGWFFLAQLDLIYREAYAAANPSAYLSYLMEFSFIAENRDPSLQKIVDRMFREINSANLKIRLATIWILPEFLINPVIHNRRQLIAELQKGLNDPAWKVRYITRIAMRSENLLPDGYRPKWTDKIFPLLFGKPSAYG